MRLIKKLAFTGKKRHKKGDVLKMARKVMNFKSKEAYRKWLAYGHIHGLFNSPGNVSVKIRGKSHRVKHSKKK